MTEYSHHWINVSKRFWFLKVWKSDDMISLAIKTKVVGVTLAQSVFWGLLIDRMFSGNTSGRTKFIFSVALELYKEGEQADSELIGTL